MNWNTVIMVSVGSMFLTRIIEKLRMRNLIKEAQTLRQASGKPIILISSSAMGGFDVRINPADITAYRLPYANKSFSALVADCLEDMSDPQQVITEWSRVADRIFINSHLFFSFENWLDLQHKYVFIGNKTIKIHPALNWGILGGVAYYYLYKRKKKPKKKLPSSEKPPNTISGKRSHSETEEEIEPEEPIPENESPELEEIVETEMEGIKVEPAPIIKPIELKGLSRNSMTSSSVIEKEEVDGKKEDMFDKITWQRGTVNLNIGDTIDNVTSRLKDKNVTNLTFDPVKMTESHNQNIMSMLDKKQADTVTLNILEHIKDKDERSGALQIAQENVKHGGKVYINVSEPKKYIREIRQFFPTAKIEDNYVLGVKIL